MDLISPAQRVELFNSFERDAFRLELIDDYGSPIENTPYAPLAARRGRRLRVAGPVDIDDQAGHG
ncbi:hypothetical protein O7599_17920 [Streptomyces sp. WMMC500]|uniref:hypothetical protein n=1 Tax=Streptomyces sp. WMMC500 TaxID=3015154 RepID=UPI00248BEF3B|nr:hypothetical protein [Streptomyces sp. WMMC500]WBB64269.1 hypothetical protein O7599_17920 [Streptomyces sp. WMMC500]